MTIAVLHLLTKEPDEPLQRFLESHERHDPGIEHELVLIANAWTGAIPARARSFRTLDLREIHFDLGAYLAAASVLDADHFCFLNSFSVILDDGWLRKLFDAATAPGVGLAGVTGSYESHYSGSMYNALRGVADGLRMRRAYDSFPNPHIRTNAFMIRRDLLLGLDLQRPRTKDDAEQLESGSRGLTRAVERRGLAAVVVGRDGVSYPRERFRESHTFRISEQCNLLVADNRTEQYAAADEAERATLRHLAWGSTDDLRCDRCGGGA